jgi:hypothetical protein
VGEPPSEESARCRVNGRRAPEHAIARGEVIGTCSDLKLYWSAEICTQITAQTEKEKKKKTGRNDLTIFVFAPQNCREIDNLAK